MIDGNVLFAFGLTLFAGIMSYVSFMEIVPKVLESLETAYGPSKGYVYTTIAFFIGILIIDVIDKLVPEQENPHEILSADEMTVDQRRGK
jgi:ZIP family zinc transporter